MSRYLFHSLFIASLFTLLACSEDKKNEKRESNKEQTKISDTISKEKDNFTIDQKQLFECVNDSLNELSCLISGIPIEAKVLTKAFKGKQFLSFSENFEKKWKGFDTSRIKKLVAFRENEIKPVIGETKKLFYPFSGPDILYSSLFFPDADEYILMGLEPVGTLPIFDEQTGREDSLEDYFKKVNTSLHAILKFSFFRTASMKTDLKNTELDGTLHLLFLFLKRTGHEICKASPVYLDSMGNITYLNSFVELQKKKTYNRGIEIIFTDKDKSEQKRLLYFSLNLADGGLKPNKGMMKYLAAIGPITTYLKGASYLMHKDYFGIIKNTILNNSNYVIQDDSGIAFHYFIENVKWEYKFYGKYLHPIPMFKQFYQKDLDSAYKVNGSMDIGFGIGYNFKDKNSNFMIAVKKK